MISYHNKDTMIGQTFESMLRTYRHYWHTWSVAHHHMSTHQSVTTEKKATDNTDAMAESHSWWPKSWLGWFEVVIGLIGLISSHREKKDDLLPSKNIWDETGHPSRLLQECMDGARPEWSWRESPMQDGTVGGWTSGGWEGTGCPVKHILFFTVLLLLGKLFSSTWWIYQKIFFC